ncbi:MAG: autotransporter assembly complex protein TamA [Burkholderiales bacterium]|jgi:translocation and assembly module TamA|nr:BamA/TamA family outer membrane protein [Burkholderiales bacterium]MCZ8106992.1 BamA/TamA family outer membrane protein [Burkholderiales bacterium]
MRAARRPSAGTGARALGVAVVLGTSCPGIARAQAPLVPTVPGGTVTPAAVEASPVGGPSAGEASAVAPAGAAPAAGTPAAADGAATPAPAARKSASNPFARLPVIGRLLYGEPVDDDPSDGRVSPHYALDVEAPEPVARQVREYTLLGRWRQRPDFDPSQRPLFVRRAEGEVRELMAAEGWFSPQIRVEDRAEGVRVVVEPGPRAVVAGTALQLSGDIESPEHAALRERVERAWQMPEGAPFRSAEWERAKRELLGTLRDGGFLRARIQDSEAIVQREGALALLRVDVESGPRLRFGAIDIAGLQRYPAEVVQGLAPFRQGEPYDANQVTRFQTLLNGSGWFTTANVRPDTVLLDRDPTVEEVPMRVDVVERQSKRWVLGGGYDTDRGFSALANWEHRNVGGLGVQTFNGVEVDLERQVLWSTWNTPQDLAGWRWQFGGRAEHRDIQNDLVDAASLFVSRNRRRGDVETALSLQAQAERQNVVFGPADERLYENRALVLGYSWTQRKLDSPIYPTRGYIVTGQLSGASEALGSTTRFVRGYGLAYGIAPLAGADREEFGRIVLRGEIGHVAAPRREGIPSANLFRTGGARSVRGYSSQGLGVPLGEAIVGGRALFTASVEYQHLIGRDVALATFYDYGNAADSWSDLKPVAGYGVGVRWRTPVGPLNFDVAYGEAVREWRLHFSIGVVF